MRTVLVLGCFLMAGSALAQAAATSPPEPGSTPHRLLVNAIGISGSALFIANADGSDERPLLADSKLDYDASFSPDGSWIVFTSERDGPANLYRVRADGSKLERLTNRRGFDDQASVSPDGKWITFVSTRGGGVNNLWIMDLASRKARNLTGALTVPPGRRNSYFRPAWSPDGQWIAFSSDRDTAFEDHRSPGPGWEHIQRASVYIIRSNGTGLRRLSDGHEYAGSPKWSADGKRLVYYSMDAEQTFAVRVLGLDPEGKPQPTDSQIVAVTIATRAREQITTGPGVKLSPQFLGPDRIGYLIKGASRGELAYADGTLVPAKALAASPKNLRSPSWSPDGKHVVYQRYENALKQGQPLFSADPSFSLRFTGEFPAIARDGRVALTAFPHDERSVANLANGKDPASVGLLLTDVDGKEMHEIFKRPGMAAMAPTWSPDGRQLVITQGEMKLGAPSRLLRLNADGSDPKPLTDTPDSSSAFPSFSPDGVQVVYRFRSASEQGLRILDLRDRSGRTLTTQHDSFPFWSPDGSMICFTRSLGGPLSFDIFTIRPDGSGEHQVSNAPGNDSHCAWSADSRTILFSSSRLGYRDEGPLYDTGAAQPYSELFRSNPDGSGQGPITDDKWEQGTPAWVPEDLQHD